MRELHRPAVLAPTVGRGEVPAGRDGGSPASQRRDVRPPARMTPARARRITPPARNLPRRGGY